MNREPKWSLLRWQSCLPLPGHRGPFMDINPQTLSPLIALAAGILILLVPRLLNFIVAIYLIVIGVMGLMGRF
jgi:cobalamin synthase